MGAFSEAVEDDELVERHADAHGDVEGVLGAELWYLEDVVAQVERLLADALDLVACHQGYFRVPGRAEQVQRHGAVGLLQGAECPPLVLEAAQGPDCVGPGPPGHGLFGSEGRLVDVRVGRCRADAAQVDFGYAQGVGGAEHGSDVVLAADVVGHQAHPGLLRLPVLGYSGPCQLRDVLLNHGL